MNKFISLQDKETLATENGIEPDVLLSILTVETKDGGFLASGKCKILFEAHYFHRLTNGIYDQSHPNISSPIWNKALYKGGEGEWERLNEAISLNKEAALKSCSWGIPQLMGENFHEGGFGSVEEMVAAFEESEYNQVKAMICFIKSKPVLYHAVQVKDWPIVALNYNGPGYKANNYDVDLAATYSKLKAA